MVSFKDFDATGEQLAEQTKRANGKTSCFHGLCRHDVELFTGRDIGLVDYLIATLSIQNIAKQLWRMNGFCVSVHIYPKPRSCVTLMTGHVSMIITSIDTSSCLR